MFLQTLPFYLDIMQNVRNQNISVKLAFLLEKESFVSPTSMSVFSKYYAIPLSNFRNKASFTLTRTTITENVGFVF